MEVDEYTKLLAKTTGVVLAEDRKEHAEPASDTAEAKDRLRQRETAPPGGKASGGSGKPSVATPAEDAPRFGVNVGGIGGADFGPARQAQIAADKAAALAEFQATH